LKSSQLNIAITCYPSVGGSGILATALGEQLSLRGHQVHFISYERPFRLPANSPNIHFHPVQISDYGLFKYPDYTLPLSVKLAEITRSAHLDILHMHYAVPHATAAILARDMLPRAIRPKVVTTLHGTDTTLLGADPAYSPAIHHALTESDAVTAVSHYLKGESQRVLNFAGPIEVIHNFFTPRPPRRSREEVRRELGIGEEPLIIHCSNLRPGKRIDVLLGTIAKINPRRAFKLLVLAGEDFSSFMDDVRRMDLEDRILVRHRVDEIEEYFQAADLGLITSDNESFCLSILEAMCLARPRVATKVGGIPEVIEDGVSGLLAPARDAESLARAVESLLDTPARRIAMGLAAKQRAESRFSADTIVPQYEALYRRISATGPSVE
jgi:L-malate glycosyltransferase